MCERCAVTHPDGPCMVKGEFYGAEFNHGKDRGWTIYRQNERGVLSGMPLATDVHNPKLYVERHDAEARHFAANQNTPPTPTPKVEDSVVEVGGDA